MGKLDVETIVIFFSGQITIVFGPCEFEFRLIYEKDQSLPERNNLCLWVDA